ISIVDPDQDCEFHLSGNKLSITIPGENHDLHPKRGMNAPRVLRKVTGDFTVQVKVTSDFKPGRNSANGAGIFVGAGLLFWQADGHFPRIERNPIGSAPSLSCFPPLIEYWRDGHYQGFNENATSVSFFKGRSTWLKARRTGNDIAISLSHDGEK